MKRYFAGQCGMLPETKNSRGNYVKLEDMRSLVRNMGDIIDEVSGVDLRELDEDLWRDVQAALGEEIEEDE